MVGMAVMVREAAHGAGSIAADREQSESVAAGIAKTLAAAQSRK